MAKQEEEVWSANLSKELSFWRRSLTDDSQVGEKHRQRLEVTELPEWVRQHIPQGADPVRLLDVGSGPLTTLGTVWPGRTLEVIALDPLADAYNEMLDELGLVAPTRPVAGRVEQLSELFAAGSFDFVHTSNALDHSADPMLGIEQMMRVLKPGCRLYLIHYKNVGESESYHGLHQWNLSPVDGDMEIWGHGRSSRLSELLPDDRVTVTDHGGEFFMVLVQKRA